MPDFTIPTEETESSPDRDDLIPIIQSSEDRDTILSTKIRNVLRRMPSSTITLGMLTSALQDTIAERKIIVGTSFPSNAVTHQVFLFTAANNDIDAVDRDGSTAKTAARAFDLFRYNGSDWQYIEFIGELTYTLGIAGETITLTPSEGDVQEIILPVDDDTTYDLSIGMASNRRRVTLTPSEGQTQVIHLPTYTISSSGNRVSLIEADGADSSSNSSHSTRVPYYTLGISDRTITLTRRDPDDEIHTYPVTLPPDNDTTYGLSISDRVISLTSDDSAQEITIPANTNTTYTLDISDRTITLEDSEGNTWDVELPEDVDTNTTYTMRLTGREVALLDQDGTAVSTIDLPAGSTSDTTYTLAIDGSTVTLTDSDGNAQSIILPAGSASDTTYELRIDGNMITLAGSNGAVYPITLPDDVDTNTTYSFSLSGNVLTVTPSEGDAQSFTLPSGEDTNTTYTMSLSGSTLSLNPSDGGTPSTVALPTADDLTYSFSVSGNTLTITPSRGGSAQTVNLPLELPDARDLDAGKSLIVDRNGNYTLSDVIGGEELDLLWEAGEYLESIYTGTSNKTIKGGKSFADYGRIVFWLARNNETYARKGQVEIVPYDLFRLSGDQSIGTVNIYSGASNAASHIQFYTSDTWMGVRWIDDRRWRRTGGGLGVRKIYGVRTPQDL